MARSPNKPKSIGISADRYDAQHEELLLTASEELPQLLSEEIHSVQPLNRALVGVRKKRLAELQAIVKKHALPHDKEKIWLAAADLQLEQPNIKHPSVRLGVNLYRHVDARGEMKNVPEALSVVDFVVDIDMPTWNIGFVDDQITGLAITSPMEAIYSLGHSLTKLRVLGLVFNDHVTLGNAVQQIAALRNTGMVDSVRANHYVPERPFLLGITSRKTLYEALRPEIDMLWVDEEDEKSLKYSFGHLLRIVNVTAE